MSKLWNILNLARVSMFHIEKCNIAESGACPVVRPESSIDNPVMELLLSPQLRYNIGTIMC